MDYNHLDKQLTVIIIIGLIVLIPILILNYYSAESTGNTNNPNNVNIPISISKDNINISEIIISNITVDDQKFMSVMKAGTIAIRNDIKSAMDSSNKNDLNGFQKAGKNLQQDSSKYAREINNINVSYQFKIISIEYKRALQKFYEGGEYIQSGVINPTDINLSIDYINAGLGHIENIDIILKNSRLT